MSIAVTGIRKRYGEFVALDGIDLEVQTGQLVALLGPSGCGKTTLLRIVAGLETPDTGRVWLHGADATELPAQHRRVGFVFQHYALFRHMSVRDNVAFGLAVRRRRERPPAATIRAKVQELLDLVQLEWAAERLPSQLSGGQRQRVALARALAIEPQVLLLDEPFGALDTQVRQELRRWLRRLHDALHFTSVFVTHDQQEALEVADAVVVLNRGRIEQRGTPQEVYDRPASAFVHRFVGASHELPAERRDGRVHVGPLAAGADAGPDGPLTALVRPHDLELRRDGEGWPARVLAVRVLGPLVHVDLQADGLGAEPLVAALGRDRYDREPLEPGDAVRLAIRRCGLYAAQGGRVTAPVSAEELGAANDALARLDAPARVRWILDELPGEHVLTSSFGAQAAVMLHLAVSARPDMPVVLLDTGYLFPETYRFVDELSTRLRLDLRVYRAGESAAWQEARHGRLWEQGTEGIERYNRINKVEPLERALAELRAGTWLSGLRRSQSATRAAVPFVEQRDGRCKAHPIADWTDRDVGRYLQAHALPYHPLWERGYVSIGDWHSTHTLAEAGSVEATRFFGLKRECGIHGLEG